MPVFLKIAEHAKLTPNKTAYNFAGDEISYKTLYQRAKKLYKALFSVPIHDNKDYGLAPNGRLVLMILPNHLFFAEIFAAASHRPHCVSILSPETPKHQIHEIIHRLKPDVIVVENSNHYVIDCAKQAGIFTLNLADTPSDTPPSNNKSDQQDYNDFCQKADKHKEILEIDYPHHPFFIGFTSGTTGLPKAFIRDRLSWRQSLQDSIEIFDLRAEAKVFSCGPLAHGVSLYALVEALYRGASFISVKNMHDTKLLVLLQKANRFIGVPSQLALISQKANKENIVFNNIKQFISAAAKFEQKHWHIAKQLFPQCDIMQYYGASELGFIAVNTMQEQMLEHNAMMSAVGNAFKNVEVTIREHDGRPCQTNNIGTIFVKSTLIASRYLWGDDGQSFQILPFGATVGDLGLINEQGALYVVGRAGNMIISGGNNIYLAEIETALKKIAGIKEVLCFGIDDTIYGTRLVAIIEYVEHIKYNQHDIEQACLDYLPKFKIPKNIYSIKNWPMTYSGKISRGKLITEVETILKNKDYTTTLLEPLQ